MVVSEDPRATADEALIGRASQRERLAGVLDEARAGRSGVLVVRGEPGAGKSALIADCIAGADDFLRLEARGVESEAEFAFSGLHDLLRPILDARAHLPEPRRAAVEAALALGPADGADPLGIAAATLGMISAAAELESLLVVIEDLHWVDSASAEAILFALRRLRDDPVAALIATRPGVEVSLDGLSVLDIEGMDLRDALELLAARWPELDPSIARRLHAATGGNPLALLQAPALLSESQIAGDEPLAGPLPVDEAIGRAFRAELTGLSEPAQRAVVVIAAAEVGTPTAVVMDALERLEIDESALDEIEDAGLVSVSGGSVAFPHPLFRSAAYLSGRRSWARTAHRALGRALAASGRAEPAAWQLAAAARGPDREVAASLEAAAAGQRSRGGYTAAGWAMKRAAELSDDELVRARRRLAAAGDFRLAGRIPAAVELLDGIAPDGLPSSQRFDLEYLRGQIEGWRAPLSDVHDALVGYAELVADESPERAALLLNEAALPHLRVGNVQTGLRTAQRAWDLGRGTEAEMPTAWTRSVALVLAGSAPEARPAIEGFAREVESDPARWRSATLYQLVPRALMWLGELRRARSLARSFLDGGAPSGLPIVLATLGEIAFRTGDFVAARAHAAEAASLARDTQQPLARAFALAGLARADAVAGTEERCREHAAEAREIGERLGAGSPIVELGASALGFLELSLGRAEEALGPLGAVRDTCSARGLIEPSMVQFGPNLVEALARSGRADEARAELAALDAAAESSDGGWARASVLRCRGLLDDGFEEPLEASIAAFDELDLPFDAARSELCLGERLRRHKRRSEARERLRRAAGEFDRMGAERWAERARTEIGVSGEKARKRSQPGGEGLTSQELQVALVVAEGATNKEAGARLYLSAKTIEAHLGRIYRKLGIRSRTELAGLVLSGGLPTGSA